MFILVWHDYMLLGLYDYIVISVRLMYSTQQDRSEQKFRLIGKMCAMILRSKM